MRYLNKLKRRVWDMWKENKVRPITMSKEGAVNMRRSTVTTNSTMSETNHISPTPTPAITSIMSLQSMKTTHTTTKRVPTSSKVNSVSFNYKMRILKTHHSKKPI